MKAIFIWGRVGNAQRTWICFPRGGSWLHQHQCKFHICFHLLGKTCNVARMTLAHSGSTLMLVEHETPLDSEEQSSTALMKQ